MNADFFKKNSIVELSTDEVLNIQGGLVSYIPTAHIGRAVKEVVEFAIGEIADFGQGLWDGLSPLFK